MAAPFALDRESILERLGGDEEIYAMMVEMYLQDVERNCNALEQALVAGDAQTLQREAHTVKSLMATFSDAEGAAEAQTVEHRARDGSVAAQAGEIGMLQLRLREIAAVLGAG